MKPIMDTIRCAIYTRVSTDAGLDQDFNSLDAQHDAASAYIRSQAHAGWTPVRTRYDDGGFSGGSTDRPALQQLLTDVRTRRINVIVVYKVDRLTRSLADFAKLVETFDTHEVSFVSVTQQFNTTTSMGRLTLNVLLSFAQFEREVTSERIRDKIGASKRKGLWVGGVVPLGYHAKDRRITVVEAEAKTVRHIYRRYLELESLNLLLADLRCSGIKTKLRPLSTGRSIGGIPFTRGPLAYMLRNRFYVGEVSFKGEIFKGEQPSILDRTLFDAVQAKLEQQRTNRATSRHSSGSILTGLIFDDRGNRMTPSYTLKKGLRYRYYTTAALLQGDPGKAGTIRRVAADQIEKLIVAALRKHIGKAAAQKVQGIEQASEGDLVRRLVARVDVHASQLLVTVHSNAGDIGKTHAANRHSKNQVLRIAWKKQPSKMRREIIPASRSKVAAPPRPIRSETRATLVSAIARGRYWLDEIISGKTASVSQIAKREHCSTRQVNLTISLAFLSPVLVQAAVDGKLPRGIGVASLRDAPADWAAQHKLLGFDPAPGTELV